MWPTEFAAWLDSPAGAGAALGVACVLGSMLGSFLNVVAHRVPRGETVVHGRSRCPACGSMIRARDNVPILGWLFLRGRCRDCRAPIAVRYPLVEGACGLLAAAVAAAEMAKSPGGDLGGMVSAWVGRTALAMTLVAWAMLAARGRPASGRTMGVAVVVAMLAAVGVDALRPLPVGCAALTVLPGWSAALVASFVGLVTGVVAGGIAGGPSAAACTLVGAALGWQAAILAAVAACAGRMVGRRDATVVLAPVAVVVAAPQLGRAWEALCRTLAAG